MELTIASQNQNKIAEIQSKLSSVSVVGLSKELFPNELIENSPTLEGNAIQKLRQVFSVLRTNCFADDTGLEIEALNGEPGVYSARYAGDHKNSEDNMQKVLKLMNGHSNRAAQFRTVIALNWGGKEHIFEGICKGRIAKERKGAEGFGYDPIFIPENSELSFAQMSMEQKNEISHRGKAVDQLVHFINSEQA
ncbi:MAG: RdgB/HAM1 family non-canonical purine NTP pyrophosphatase [Bacteroidia bacterium]